jgi:hypothetical protein
VAELVGPLFVQVNLIDFFVFAVAVAENEPGVSVGFKKRNVVERVAEL